MDSVTILDSHIDICHKNRQFFPNHQIKSNFSQSCQRAPNYFLSFIYDELVPGLVEGVESFHWPNHGFDESYLLFRETVFLVKHLVGPRMREVLEGDELIDLPHCMLSIFLLKN